MDEQAREIRDAYDRVFSDESIVLILFVSAMLLSPVL